ncbi:hypothetical protein HY632_05120 [Candidatus Uhrbacteria bacterium]|nr:hypothetical protein [Candidatus Uhrbacteria bacterium]
MDPSAMIETTEQWEQLQRKLFGHRPRSTWLFGESIDASGFADRIAQERTGDISELPLAQQIAAAHGLHPLLVVTHSIIADRDLRSTEAFMRTHVHESDGTFRYTTHFSTSPGVTLLMRELEHSLRTQLWIPEIAVSEIAGSRVVCWPVRKGHRIVEAFLGRVPIPGPRGNA